MGSGCSAQRVAPSRTSTAPAEHTLADKDADNHLRQKARVHVNRAMAVLHDPSAVQKELEALMALLGGGGNQRQPSAVKPNSQPEFHRRDSSSQMLEALREWGRAAEQQSAVNIRADPKAPHESEGEPADVQEWLKDALYFREAPQLVHAELSQATADLVHVAGRGDGELLRECVRRHGIPVDQASGFEHRTALHVAASEGMIDMVKILIEELKAHSSPVDRFGHTPLDEAVRGGHDDVVDYLSAKANGKHGPRSSIDERLRRASDIHVDPSSELFDAAAVGDVEKLRDICRLPAVNVDRGDVDERTALHLAVAEGQRAAVSVLLDELHAEPSPIDRWGATPLDDAQRQRHTEIVQLLTAKGAKNGRRLLASREEALPPPPTPMLQPSPLWVAPAALERCLSGEYAVQLRVDERAQLIAARALDSWGHDVIGLHEASGGHALVVIGEALLHRHGLIAHFGLDRHVVRRFLVAAEAAYAREDAATLYHNSVHGADVALTTHLFLTKFGQVERLSKTQLLAVIVAAMMHDFNHPNTTNSHEVRALMIELILATDLSKHFDFVSRLRTLCSTQGAAAAAKQRQPWSESFHAVDLSLVLPVAIKFADLGHSFKSNAQHRVWTQRVTDEFHALGDAERRLGVPISALCDRHLDTNIAKSQVGFFRCICLPFYSAVADLIDPNMIPFRSFQENFRAWQLESMEQSAQGVADNAQMLSQLRRQASLHRSATEQLTVPAPLANEGATLTRYDSSPGSHRACQDNGLSSSHAGTLNKPLNGSGVGSGRMQLQPLNCNSSKESLPGSRNNSRRSSLNPAMMTRNLRATGEILLGDSSVLGTTHE